MNKAFLVSAIWMAAILSACGSDSSKSFSSGIDPAKTISTLSSDQQHQLCQAKWAYSQEVPSRAQQCKLIALSSSSPSSLTTLDSEVQTACKTHYDDCMAATIPTSFENSDIAACLSSISTCDATVGQFSACTNDGADSRSRWIDTLPSCASDTVEDVDSITFPPQPASCKTFGSLCH